jgi:hypothetical protein
MEAALASAVWHRAAYGGRMPALLMQRHRLANQELGPDLIPCHVSRKQVGPARADDLTLRDDRGNQHCAGMAVERHVVIVEHMGSGAIDERRVLGIALVQRRNERCQLGPVRARNLLVQQPHDRIPRPRNHHTEAVGDPDLGNGLGLGRNVGQRDARYEASELGGKGGHRSVPFCGCPAMESLRSRPVNTRPSNFVKTFPGAPAGAILTKKPASPNDPLVVQRLQLP